MGRMACVALLALGWTLTAAAEPIVFDGTFVPTDSPGYHPYEFDVPEGTSRISVAYSYESEGDQSPVMGNVVDIAIYDPDGFRGSSGGARSDFTVALTAEDTTDAYIPGPIPAGTWTIELGTGYIASGSTTSFELTIALADVDEDVEPFEWPEWDPPVLGGPGWYAGDLHSHSLHSDGSHPLEDVFAYAHATGLDFMASSEHFTFSAHHELPALQAQYGDMVLIRGIEMTSYRGHANVFGVTGYVDYHASESDYDIGAVIGAVHDAGGLFSVNHPGHFEVETEGGTVSLGWTVPDTDWADVDCMEVVNGASTWLGDVVNPLNENAIALWDEVLTAGHRVAAVGGSDDHKAGTGDADADFYYAPMGTPTTVVYAEELSEAGILEALAAGHAFLKADGPDGPDLYLTAACGDGEGMMGDVVAGPECVVSARVVGGDGLTLRVIQDGEVVDDPTVSGDDVWVYADVDPQVVSYVRVELRDGDLLKALSNPVYLVFAEDDGEEIMPYPPEDGCGCSAADRGAAPWVVGLLVAALLARRRMRGPGLLGLVLLAGCTADEVGQREAKVWVQIDLEDDVPCAIASDGELRCWGCPNRDPHHWPMPHLCTPPMGGFVDMAVGDAHICAATTGGEVVCWGSGCKYGQCNPPTGDFVHVAVGGILSCGLRAVARWNAGGVAPLGSATTRCRQAAKHRPGPPCRSMAPTTVPVASGTTGGSAAGDRTRPCRRQTTTCSCRWPRSEGAPAASRSPARSCAGTSTWPLLPGPSPSSTSNRSTAVV